MADSKSKEATPLEEALLAVTKKLQQFTNASVEGGHLNATRAAELVEAVHKQLKNVDRIEKQQRDRAKEALKVARQRALAQVRTHEAEARDAVRSWRSHGRRAVQAQRAANLPEHYYESHDDNMRDAVGDAEDRVEGAADQLKDEVNDHYGKLENDLEDASFNARAEALRHGAEKAEHRLRELARNLGAEAALREAQAAARFGAEERSWKASKAPQMLAALPQSANVSSEVRAAQALEAQAADGFQSRLSSLRDTSAEEVISKASQWQTLHDLAAASRPSGSDSWEKALEANTKKLEQFNNESRQSAMDFDASRAAELADAVHKASAHVEHDVEEQKHNMRAAMKDARHRAHQHVKMLEAEAKTAAKAWKYHGRRAVKAQRAARVPEHVYEHYDDRMRDAVGDAEDKAEDAAERLEDKVGHHYEKLEDDFEDASLNARAEALRHGAEKAEHRLRELARNLGAEAALREAQAAARFGAEEKSWKAAKAPQMLAALPQSANVSSEVRAAQALEAQAADGFQSRLSSLRDTSAEEVISKASQWQTLHDLAAASRPSGSDSWEKALEANTKKLEQFNNESRQSAMDFDASRAAELADAVHKASAHVEHDVEEQKHNMRAAMKDARHRAHQHVKMLEAEAKTAAKAWKYHGRRAVKAQRAARVPEHVYEHHDDRMRDAVGDAEDKAEDAAERLEDKVGHHYEKLEDDFEDASLNARAEALRHGAEKAEHRLQELARNLGAEAALREAQAAARFGAEEKSWKAAKAPQMLAALPQSANVSSEVRAAQALEAQAADGFQSRLSSLRDTSAEEVISKASQWQTLHDLAAASRPSGSDSWEKALEANTKKLEQFNNESRQSAMDFDASRAAELADAVHKASAHVEHDVEEQKHNMRAAMKDARHRAHQHVKMLEAEAKTAAKAWKYHGRRAVKAQRAARVPEHVYEHHDDRMRDAVGDAEDKAEDAAERLEDKVGHHYEKLEDDFEDASLNARAKALRHGAEKAEHRLQELARNLGAEAALREAQAAARFGAEEKSWKAAKAPQQLLGHFGIWHLVFPPVGVVFLLF